MRANVATLEGNNVRPQILRVIARGDIAGARQVIEDNCAALTFDPTAPACPASVDSRPWGLLLGDPDRARAELRAVFANTPADSALGLAVVGLLSARFDVDLATEAFGKALLLDTAGLQFAWTPIMEPVRRHPGFKRVMTEMKLPDYWRAAQHWPELCRPLGERDFECF